MKIQVLFFGICTDLIGENSLEFKVQKDTTVKQLKQNLIAKYPSLKNINDFAIAVNEEYAEDEFILQKKDVVAIIPPVSGG